MSVNRSTTNVDVVSIIGTSVSKGAECEEVVTRLESFACCRGRVVNSASIDHFSDKFQ